MRIFIFYLLRHFQAVHRRHKYICDNDVVSLFFEKIKSFKTVGSHIYGFKKRFEKLSGCLRQYIENRFQLRAPEQTTEEFLEQLKTSDALKLEHKQELQKFLEHCDLVKFARYQPSNEQINESLTMAEAFVDKTKSVNHLVDVTGQGERQVAS